jgi:hypothetical protein
MDKCNLRDEPPEPTIVGEEARTQKIAFIRLISTPLSIPKLRWINAI